MKNILAVMVVMLFSTSWINSGFSEPIDYEQLPSTIQQTIQNELGRYKVRNIEHITEKDRIFYHVGCRGRMGRRLDLIIDNDGTLLKKMYEDQFSVQDNRLLIEERDFWIHSIYTPEAGNPQQAPRAILEAIGNISYAGGNILAFDLYGLTPDGAAFTPEADSFYQSLIDRLLYTNINCICKVFHSSFTDDPKIRFKSIQTVANYFKDENQYIFWIDGPNATDLAQEFKRIAPKLVVAAPGADIDFTDSFSSPSDRRPTVYLGHLPDKTKRQTHFLLPNLPESFDRLDQWNAHPLESQPWVPDNSLISEEERNDGFIALFDGKTKNGWVPLSSNQEGFIIENGELRRNPGGGTIRTVKRFDDFILRLDYRIEENGNSGVQVRCPRSNRASKIGFEIQILGDYGREPDKNSTGSIYNEIPPLVNASKPANEWNSIEIMCHGPHVKVTLNGIVVQDLNFDEHIELKYRLRDGFIFLTDHGADVAYKNIRLKEL